MKHTAENPSPAYLKALGESRQHHRVHKTWSGNLAMRHMGRIKALIDEAGCADALDYGCGKCVQYFTPMADGQTAEPFLGVPVFKYDPAMPADFRRPLVIPRDYEIASELPEGRKWYLVIATHALGSIPIEDLKDWVVPLLFRSARKAIYIAENLNVPKKDGLFSDVSDKPREWTAEQWMDLFKRPGRPRVKVEAWFRGTPGNNPRETGDDGPDFRRWPFEA